MCHSLLLLCVNFLSEDMLQEHGRNVKVCQAHKHLNQRTKHIMQSYCDGIGVLACIILGPAYSRFF